MTTMASMIVFPTAIGASILFGFGFDKRANFVSNAWAVVAASAVVLYMLTTWNNTVADTRYMTFACVACELTYVGALCYFLAWVTTVNKSN